MLKSALCREEDAEATAEASLYLCLINQPDHRQCGPRAPSHLTNQDYKALRSKLSTFTGMLWNMISIVVDVWILVLILLWSVRATLSVYIL